jgi:hypothetical protein
MATCDSIWINELICQAQLYWADDEPLPLDLAVEMMMAGLDVEALEGEYRQ